jgi:hypothetical protein
MLGDAREDWLAARLDDLDYGDIDGMCTAARAYPLTGIKKDELDTALGYFETILVTYKSGAHPSRCRDGGAEVQEHGFISSMNR